MTTVYQIEKQDYEDFKELTARMEKVVSTCEQLIAAQSHKHEIPERGGVEFACRILGRSKSWLYKMIAVLPHKKFNNTLIFDRIELESWLADNTENPGQHQEIINNALAASAAKKLVKN